MNPMFLMSTVKIGLFILAVIFVIAAAVAYPASINVLDLVDPARLVQLAISAVLFSLFISVLTVLAVVNTTVLELSSLVLLSFGVCVLLVGVEPSLIVLLTIIYCRSVIRNTQILKKPSPGFSVSHNMPKLFMIFGFIFAIIVGSAAKPELDPELFSPLEQFAESIIGCSPETQMVQCIREKARQESGIEEAIYQCQGFPEPQKSMCVNQLESQFDGIIDKTIENYSRQGTINSTVGDFLKSTASKQFESLVGGDPTQLKIVSGVAAFSVVSTIGGPVTLLTSLLSSLLMAIFLKTGIVKESEVRESVIRYQLE